MENINISGKQKETSLKQTSETQVVGKASVKQRHSDVER